MDKLKPVISASRRTDIPAFYTPWFLECIRQKRLDVVNPYNRHSREVDLGRDAVHSIVFWSKNYGPFLALDAHERLKDAGYPLFFNFTVNAPNRLLEPGVPDLASRFSQVAALAACFDPAQITWRFDPICFYTVNGKPADTFKGVEPIARQMADLGISRCITSFYDTYAKVDARIRKMAAAGGPKVQFQDPGIEKSLDLVNRMETFLGDLGIQLSLCCERQLINALPPLSRVSAAACIDGRRLKQVLRGTPVTRKDYGQRRKLGCQCTQSIDIGDYTRHPCYHNCLFCYARIGQDMSP